MTTTIYRALCACFGLSPSSADAIHPDPRSISGSGERTAVTPEYRRDLFLHRTRQRGQRSPAGILRGIPSQCLFRAGRCDLRCMETSNHLLRSARPDQRAPDPRLPLRRRNEHAPLHSSQSRHPADSGSP